MLLHSPAWLSVSASPTAVPLEAQAACRLQALEGMQTRLSRQRRGRQQLTLQAAWEGASPFTQPRQGPCRRCWGVWNSREVGKCRCLQA